MEATSLRFAAAARLLGQVARRRGLDVPAFRSPPRLEGADRSLRRHASGTVTVSVRYRGRPWPAVLADMIDGVVAANRLAGNAADRSRTALWAAVETDSALAARSSGPGRARLASRSASGADDVTGDSAPGARRFPARLPERRPTSSRGQSRSSGPLRAVPARHVA